MKTAKPLHETKTDEGQRQVEMKSGGVRESRKVNGACPSSSMRTPYYFLFFLKLANSAKDGEVKPREIRSNGLLGSWVNRLLLGFEMRSQVYNHHLETSELE